MSTPAPATSAAGEWRAIVAKDGETYLKVPNDDESDFHRVDYPESLAEKINASLAALREQLEAARKRVDELESREIDVCVLQAALRQKDELAEQLECECDRSVEHVCLACRILAIQPDLSALNAVIEAATAELREGLQPPHECDIIARAPDMAEGRDWWIGRLTKPVFVKGIEEKFCLHLKTPLKDVVFLLNEADLGQIATLMGCAQGKPIYDGWVEHMMPSAFDAARNLSPDSLSEQATGVSPKESAGAPSGQTAGVASQKAGQP